LGKQRKFCEVLSEMLGASGKSRVAFYTELGITKSYFYDILGGKVSPPPAEKQFKIIEILNPEPDICEEFFELAAKERDEMPADLVHYIDEPMRKGLRNKRGYKKMMDSFVKRKTKMADNKKEK